MSAGDIWATVALALAVALVVVLVRRYLLPRLPVSSGPQLDERLMRDLRRER